MTDVRSFFEKKYIGSWDIPDEGAVVVIDRCVGGVIEGMDGLKQRKPILYFRNVKNLKKGMVFGATVAKTMIALYGKDVEGWVGKPITLYATQTNGKGGEIVDCIRVKPVVPQMPGKDAPKVGGDAPPPTEEDR